MKTDNKSPVLLVTGGSRGIGAAVAYAAALAGYRVAVNYLRSKDAVRGVIERISSSGGEAEQFRADVSQEDDIHRLFQAVDERWGRLDALVNNAGILETQAPLLEMDLRRIQTVIATNLIGPMLCCREAVRRMATSRGGRGGGIVNVGSLASRTGSPHEYVDYAASKGGLDSLTIGLSKEVASEGIRVNGVRPAYIETDIHAAGGEPDRVARVSPTLPMKRGGSPEEVAAAILWLLSPQASYVTGSFLELTGGR